jgi:Ca2+-binding EF-hand superfamily protein
MRKILAAVAILGLASGTFAFAQDAGKAEEAFKKLDKNGDSKLTLEEFKEGAKDATKAEGRFKRIDKDGDGNVTLEEFKAGFGKKKDKKD